jgi:hypothetical protein
MTQSRIWGRYFVPGYLGQESISLFIIIFQVIKQESRNTQSLQPAKERTKVETLEFVFKS